MTYAFRMCVSMVILYLVLCGACWIFTCWYQQRLITEITSTQFLGGGLYLLKWLLA